MTDKVWISSVLSNPHIGDKQGIRTKFYNEEWEPASFVLPVTSEAVLANLNRYVKGFTMQRTELPECAAVWHEDSFKRVKDLFVVGGFFAVRAKLAEVLSRFDIGEGGLVPFPIYESDLVTIKKDNFFLINFGARKNSFLPAKSENVEKFAVVKATGLQTWKVNSWHEDDDVAVSPAALNGSHLWFEEIVFNKIFISEALAAALVEAGLADDWCLRNCRIMEEGQ